MLLTQANETYTLEYCSLLLILDFLKSSEREMKSCILWRALWVILTTYLRHLGTYCLPIFKKVFRKIMSKILNSCVGKTIISTLTVVTRIEKVEKPVTSEFVSLIAWFVKPNLEFECLGTFHFFK